MSFLVVGGGGGGGGGNAVIFVSNPTSVEFGWVDVVVRVVTMLRFLNFFTLFKWLISCLDSASRLEMWWIANQTLPSGWMAWLLPATARHFDHILLCLFNNFQYWSPEVWPEGKIHKLCKPFQNTPLLQYYLILWWGPLCKTKWIKENVIKYWTCLAVSCYKSSIL